MCTISLTIINKDFPEKDVKTTPFTIASKKLSPLTKKMNGLYFENYKILMKENEKIFHIDGLE